MHIDILSRRTRSSASDHTPATAYLSPDTESEYSTDDDYVPGSQDTKQMQTMSTLVDNFEMLFNAATGAPNYTQKLQTAVSHVLTPMFQDFTTQMSTNISADIKASIQTEFTSIKAEFTEIKENLLKQKEEIDALKADLTKEREQTASLKTDIHNLKSTKREQSRDLQYLYDGLQQHQKFLESVDFDKRKQNLILTGVSETDQLQNGDLTANSDEEKVSLIMNAIGKPDTQIDAVARLGNVNPSQQNQRPRNRPIKVTLNNSQERKGILEVSKDLKGLENTNRPLSKIFIKKDTHPGIRRELKRLHDVVRNEKSKPENAGRNIVYDWKERVVKIDNVIIDTYQPSFF